MKKIALITLLLCASATLFAQPRPRVKPTPAPVAVATPSDPAEQDKLELDAIAQLPFAARVEKLAAWRAAKPDSPLQARALEDVLRARAA